MIRSPQPFSVLKGEEPESRRVQIERPILRSIGNLICQIRVVKDRGSLTLYTGVKLVDMSVINIIVLNLLKIGLTVLPVKPYSRIRFSMNGKRSKW